MRNVFGGILITIGMIAMFAIWIYTSYYFFATGQGFLGLVALVVPPADLVLPFLISPLLGLIAVGGTAVAFSGFVIKGDES